MALFGSLFNNKGTKSASTSSNSKATSSTNQESLSNDITGQAQRQVTSGTTSGSTLDPITQEILKNLVTDVATTGQSQAASDVQTQINERVGGIADRSQEAIDAAKQLAITESERMTADAARRARLAGGTGLSSGAVGLESIATGQNADQLAATLLNLDMAGQQQELNLLNQGAQSLYAADTAQAQLLGQLANVLKGTTYTQDTTREADMTNLMNRLTESMTASTQYQTGTETGVQNVQTESSDPMNDLAQFAYILNAFGG